MIRKRFASIGGMICTLALAPAVFGQDFDLSWHTVDGGGGNSSGGAFTLLGTIAQADAGTLTGGAFSLQGGFIPGATSGGGEGCNGNETISKAKCKTKRGAVKKTIVKVKKGTPGQEYTAVLDTGQEASKNAKNNGKVSFKFKGNNAPECGANGVTVCGQREAFDCDC